MRLHSDVHRVDMRRLEVVPQPGPVALHFERRLRGYLEFEQQRYTTRQLSDGRIDHICAKVPPPNLVDLSVSAHMVDALPMVRNANDHVPVSVRVFARRRRHPLLRSPQVAAPHPGAHRGGGGFAAAGGETGFGIRAP